MGKAAMGGLTTIWKYRGIKLARKVKLVKTLVFAIVLYGAETWTMSGIISKIIKLHIQFPSPTNTFMQYAILARERFSKMQAGVSM